MSKEAFACLQDVLDNRIDEYTRIEFAGWPRFEMRIEGKNYHGSIPTSIMPPMLDMQKVIHKLYCQIIHGHQDVDRLTEEERDYLEIVFNIGKGSTNFSSDLAKILNRVLQSAVSKMTPVQATATVIVIVLLLTSNSAWKHYLNNQAQVQAKELEWSLQMSKEETKQIGILTNGFSMRPELRLLRDSVDDVRKPLLRSLKPEDKLSIGGKGWVVTGVVAHVLVQPIEAPKESEPKKSKESDNDLDLD